MILLRLAVRNIVKNWRHSLAAILSIAAGFMALVLFEGYLIDLRVMYHGLVSGRQMLGDIIIEKKGFQEGGHRDDWAYQLGEQDQDVVQQLLAQEGEGVRARVRFLNVGGMLTNGSASAVFVGIGYDVMEGELVRGASWRWNTHAGRPLAVDEPETVLLGNGLGAVLDCKAGDGTERTKRTLACKRSHVQLSATTEAGQLNAVDPEIVGLVDAGFKEIDGRYVAMPLTLAQRLLGTKAIAMYSVKLVDPSTAPAFAARFQAAAAARGVALEVTPWQNHPLGDIFRRSMELLGIFRSFIGTVAVVIAGMSVLNALVKSVRERTREIGTLRSLGFLRSQIVLLFSMEGALLAILAVTGGCAALFPLAWFINRHAHVTYKAGLLAEPIALTVSVTPLSCLTSAALLVCLAALAALLPARRAAALKISDALGHV